MDALLETFAKERDQKVNYIRNIAKVAEDDQRDLTETELDQITHARSRLTAIDKQMAVLSDDLEMASDTQARMAQLSPALGYSNAPVYGNAGELLWDCLHAHHERDARDRYQLCMKRAQQHMGTTAAATTPTAGGMPGLFVSPTVGPVIDIYPQGRPFLSYIGVHPAPNSINFVRPYVSDPSFVDGSGVGVQTLQKAELASKAFDVLLDTLSLTHIGGYLNVSQQLMSLMPGSLDIIISQLNRRLAKATEYAAITEFSLSTGKQALSNTADAPTTLAAFYNASAAVYASTGELATFVLMGPAGWARLGALSDGAGRPLFPYLGAANANGQMSATAFGMTGPAGLTPIVTPAITDATFWVSNGAAFEAYEYRYPLMEAQEPALLGRQIAVACSISMHRPAAIPNASMHLYP